MDKIEIDKAVAMPKVRQVYSYPHSHMEVGHSFVVPKRDRAKVLNANSRMSKKLGRTFSARTEGEVVRVWRMA
jgi:hypothetical protein